MLLWKVLSWKVGKRLSSFIWIAGTLLPIGSPPANDCARLDGYASTPAMLKLLDFEKCQIIDEDREDES
ncbi:hypothetical protein F8M41_002157 [Gigaspora margarita]|uniref:Uncharacterized protein n=1 Tax=Gigaspora margarita TaxID=4874 RepID=A0A8H3XE17_GIGMA|nr:hypothetical protein F8M41_002157 [Gigaspora margarita]